jgi:hypothetical protein
MAGINQYCDGFIYPARRLEFRNNTDVAGSFVHFPLCFSLSIPEKREFGRKYPTLRLIAAGPHPPKQALLMTKIYRENKTSTRWGGGCDGDEGAHMSCSRTWI